MFVWSLFDVGYSDTSLSLMLHQHDLLLFTLTLSKLIPRNVMQSGLNQFLQLVFVVIAEPPLSPAISHTCLSDFISDTSHAAWVCGAVGVGFRQACVKLLSPKNTTLEWESSNLITTLHWGDTRGGGALSWGSVFTRAIEENGVNDWEWRSRRGEEKEPRAEVESSEKPNYPCTLFTVMERDTDLFRVQGSL